MSASVDRILHKAQRYAKNGEAELAAQQYKIVLEKYPQNQRAIKGLKALQQLSQQQIDGLIALFRQGNFQQLLIDATALAKRFPSSSYLPMLLAEANSNLGRLEQAADNYRTAIQLEAGNPQAHNNLGITLSKLGRTEEAVSSFSKAVGIKADYVEAHNNLGNGLKDLGKLVEAAASYNRAIKIEPAYADAHNNLGIVHYELGEADEAVASFTKSLQINKANAEAQNNLGSALLDLGKIEEAVVAYAKAVELRPNYAQAENNLGIALNKLGRVTEAIAHFQKSVILSPVNKEFWRNYSELLRNFSFKDYDPQIAENFLVLLDQETVIRPAHIAASIMSFLKQHSVLKRALDELANNKIETAASTIAASLAGLPLFLRIIELSPVFDLEIEKLLRTLRRALLTSRDVTGNEQELLRFQQSLALQCFTNEYVFGEVEEETSASQALESDIEQALASGAQPADTEIACLASYRPLHSFAWCEQLQFSKNLEKLRVRQVQERREEQSLRLAIPSLGGIDDQVSNIVRAQYEQNPYPRWINTALATKPLSLRQLANTLKLRLSGEQGDFPEQPEILIAGCGTGQQALVAAKRFLGSKVLAIDLSLSSLSYAIRKTQGLGISNIDYMQADILELGSLDKQFDVIESAGVLHHMADPLAGWQVLTDCLKPGGLMKVALYSETARDSVVRARELIAEMKLSDDIKDILDFRMSIVNSSEELDSRFSRITNFSDFYSSSEFRDLLFHVQEHRFTLPQLSQCLKELDLKFAGFEFWNSSVVEKFSQTYPDPEAVYSLDKWHEFELANTDTFAGMYQLWLQK